MLAPRAVIKMISAGRIVAMVTHCVAKGITTCSPMVGKLFDAVIAASSDKEWLFCPGYCFEAYMGDSRTYLENLLVVVNRKPLSATPYNMQRTKTQ